MKPLKEALRRSIDVFRGKYPNADIKPETLARVALLPNSVWDGLDTKCPILVACSKNNIKSGFRSAGIHPYDRTVGEQKYLENPDVGVDVPTAEEEESSDEETDEVQLLPERITVEALRLALEIEKRWDPNVAKVLAAQPAGTAAVNQLLSPDDAAQLLFNMKAEKQQRDKQKFTREQKKLQKQLEAVAGPPKKRGRPRKEAVPAADENIDRPAARAVPGRSGSRRASKRGRS